MRGPEGIPELHGLLQGLPGTEQGTACSARARLRVLFLAQLY